MEKTYRVFAINPGSTSTKLALFENEKTLFSVNLRHDAHELAQFADISSQLPFRLTAIKKVIAENALELHGVDAFVGRGGGLAPVEGGVYTVNAKMLEHATICYSIPHPAALGPRLAHAFAQEYGGEAYVVNPPDVDEFHELARLTGLRGVWRESRIHALNQKETAIRHAARMGHKYEELDLIVCHIGGGISVAAHHKGKMIDGNDIADGEGPMMPTRTGALPLRAVIEMCFSGKYTRREMLDLIIKNGGLVSLLGTSDMREVEQRIDSGDNWAETVLEAMVYQIAKEIGAMSAVLHGHVDGILLTGGISTDERFVSRLKEYISFLAPVFVYPGEFEMEAMAAGAIRVISGQETALEYTGAPVWTAPEL